MDSMAELTEHVENLQRQSKLRRTSRAQGRDGCQRGDHAEVQGEGTPAEPFLNTPGAPDRPGEEARSRCCEGNQDGPNRPQHADITWPRCTTWQLASSIKQGEAAYQRLAIVLATTVLKAIWKIC